MKLSFIIIAFNEEQNLGNTLSAIFSQEQLPKLFEVIIVNDGSRDATLEVAQEYAAQHPQIKIVDLQPNQGRGAARAAGVAAAKGTYLAFVDADTILPKNWFARCLPYMDTHDACGGTAVPDGDVTWIHNTFKLTPKVATHVATVSGANGLFKRSVFDTVGFKSDRKDGEDIDLGYQMEAAGFKIISIPELLVEHCETKDYLTSLKWLYVSGKSATKQLYEHKKVRIPDLSFLGFLFVVVLTVALLAALSSHWPLLAGAPIVYLFAVSFLHLTTKFRFWKTPLRGLGALLANSSLLLAYFVGRLVGLGKLFSDRAAPQPMQKQVVVNFDYEGIWGMPHKSEPYDIEQTTRRILAVLDKYQVKATFFVVGKLSETHPGLIQTIARKGHTIGLHGYKHEQLCHCTVQELTTFGKHLEQAERQITQLTGVKPLNFRSPYLMGPRFYTPGLYALLARHGYTNVSNREVRYQQELFHPKRLRVTHWLDKDNIFTKALNLLLNLRLIATENFSGRTGLVRLYTNSKWLLTGCPPFMRGMLREVPLYSPLDCDLLGLPKPGEASSQRLLNYATDALTGGYHKKGTYYSLNFHDWIIGTENRIGVLDRVLSQLQALEATFVTDYSYYEQAPEKAST